MRRMILLLSILISLPGIAAEDAALAHAKQLLSKTLLIDGHNDLPWAIRGSKTAPDDVVAYDLNRATEGQTDLARLRAGGVGAQFWSVYIPGGTGSGDARTQLEQIDLARRMIARYPADLGFAASSTELVAEHRAGRIASLLGIEGGHAIENSLGALRAYHALGVRYMTLTHNTHTDWADAAAMVPARHGGLTPFGVEVVREMNRLGMLVDLAHTAEATMHDALDASEAPVIFSHANARAICDVPRNVPDSVLRRLPQNGGVVMITFVAGFVSEDVARITQPAFGRYQLLSQKAKTAADRERIYKEVFDKLELPPVTIAQVADHIDHVREVAGVDHVGIGGDFDGNSLWPVDLSDVSMYPNLFAELIRRGWSDEDLAKLAGGNVLRVLRTAEAVAERLQMVRPASTARIERVVAP
jgi:membrane dipeptidase